MSLKSLIQLIILIIIFIIIGGVYLKYFAKEKILVIQTSEITEKEKNKIINEEDKNNDVEKIIELSDKKKDNLIEPKKEEINTKNKKSEVIEEDNDIPNIVKDVEYLTTDKHGNKYKILARSGRTNKNNRDILDLDNVKGEITSKRRSTIFIVSDFAKYNSSTLGSKFYKNVVVKYENKQINCENFDINMDTNIAIAYNNVVVTDPKSTMRAEKITLNIETKEIEINPDISEKSKVKINTKQ